MLQLQDQFRNTKKGASTITEFCHALKNLADDLYDVESHLTKVELVMQILRQLPAFYHNIVDVITNTKPLPSFLETKDMLLLHEAREENMDAMLDSSNPVTLALYLVSSQYGKSKNKWNKNCNTNRGASKGRSNSSLSTVTKNFAGSQVGQQTQFSSILGTNPRNITFFLLCNNGREFKINSKLILNCFNVKIDARSTTILPFHIFKLKV